MASKVHMMLALAVAGTMGYGLLTMVHHLADVLNTVLVIH